MPDIGDEIIGASMAEGHHDGPRGYRDFMNCPWEGEAVLLQYSDTEFAGIFTDHKTAAGVFPVDGDSPQLAIELAQYFMDRYVAGDSATQVFDGLLKQFGIKEVNIIDRLDSLTRMSTYLTRITDEESSKN